MVMKLQCTRHGQQTSVAVAGAGLRSMGSFYAEPEIVGVAPSRVEG